MSLTSKIKGFERKEIGILQWSILAATLFCVQKRVAFFVGKIRISEGLFYKFIRNLEFGCQKMTHYLLDDKLQKGRFTLCLWKNIRKSSYACPASVMFCHGWQNKASRAMEGSLNAGHVTFKITFSSILRFSYVCTSA